MIRFIADNHFGGHPGRLLRDRISWPDEVSFSEDDVRSLDEPFDNFDLLVLHMIGGTSGLPMPSPEAAENAMSYLAQGGKVLLLHASSALFREDARWRRSVGYRWVRSDDPDAQAVSEHPIIDFDVRVIPSHHQLSERLRDLHVVADELLSGLQQVSPVTLLMETVTERGRFPQAYETVTRSGSRIVGYLPGHDPRTVVHPDNIHNCTEIVDYLFRSPVGAQR